MITLFTIESEIKMAFKVIMLLIGVNQSDSETHLLISTIILRIGKRLAVYTAHLFEEKKCIMHSYRD